jgi:hypothetical protein
MMHYTEEDYRRIFGSSPKEREYGYKLKAKRTGEYCHCVSNYVHMGESQKTQLIWSPGPGSCWDKCPYCLGIGRIAIPWVDVR